MIGLEKLEDLLARATAPEGDAREMPKALAIFAHPDDETVALGARLGRFKNACFVHITDGAPRDERDSRRHGFTSLAGYRQARSDELECAFRSSGLTSVQRQSLGIPDQGAAHNLCTITKHVAALLHSEPYEVIFTHPYEGGHPDHDACAFAVHHAVGLSGVQNESAPVIIECAFYRADLSGGNETVTESFLMAGRTPQCDYRLSREEQQRKWALLTCFVTQKETLNMFPLTVERFRIAPEYEFAKEPHLPPVLYDRYPWATSSSTFRILASQAEEALRRKEGPPCP